MKVKMFEHVQGRNIPTLLPGQIYDVSVALGAWLLEHNKAVEVKPIVKEKLEPEPQVKEEKPVEKPVRAREQRGRSKK